MNDLNLISSKDDILVSLEVSISKDEPLLLNWEVLSSIIERCINSELSEDVLFQWAEEVELAENVIYENGSESKIADILFCLSSREINGNISLNKLLSLIEIKGSASLIFI